MLEALYEALAEAFEDEAMLEEHRELAGSGEVAYMPLYFLFIGLLMGALSLWGHLKFAPWLPYTAIMFLEGIGMGVLHYGVGLGELSTSIDSWITIDPFLLMAVFLPSLIFSDAMRINMHQFQTMAFWPSVIMAMPGVILSGGIMAVVAYSFLGYDWDWYACLLFGTVLGATDPVSIVALLESSGAPARLTLLMSSESHLADLTVLVLFKFFLEIVTKGTKYLLKPAKAIKFFAKLMLIAPIVGLVFGLVGYFAIKQSVSPTRSSDVMTQITITIVTAYLSFLVSEHNFGSNGIIASVVAAWVFAKYAWPKFAKRETMENVWAAIEYVGNTLIFLLAGLILGGTTYNAIVAGNLTGRDIANVVVMWLFLFLSRLLIVMLFFPVIKAISKGKFTFQEALATVAGGVRGAVTITLAIVVLNSADNYDYQAELPNHFGASYDAALHKFFFIVGSIVLLTVTVNEMTFRFVLKYLSLTKSTKPQETLQAYVQKRVHENAVRLIRKIRKEDAGYSSVSINDVANLIGDETLRGRLNRSDRGTEPKVEDPSDEIDPDQVTIDQCDQELLITVRTMFLNAVRAQYWEQINGGKLPKKSDAAVLLLNSVDIAGDDIDNKLDDLSPLNLGRRLKATPFMERALDFVDACLPERVTIDNYVQSRLINKRREEAVYMCTCFNEAHLHAESKIAEYVGEDATIDTFEEAYVIKESRELRARAQAFLDSATEFDAEVVKQVNIIKVANAIVESERLFIEGLAEQGIIDAKFFEDQMEVIRADQGAIAAHRRRRFRALASDRSTLHIVPANSSQVTDASDQA